MNMYREFEVPPVEEFVQRLGVVPEQTEEVGVIALKLGGGYPVTSELTVDVLGRSLSLRLIVEQGEIARIYREGATVLRLSESAPEVSVEFRTSDSKGTLQLSLHPSLQVVETALLA
jgi:hypothetical protein